jgi:hypothetical protein
MTLQQVNHMLGRKEGADYFKMDVEVRVHQILGWNTETSDFKHVCVTFIHIGVRMVRFKGFGTPS